MNDPETDDFSSLFDFLPIGAYRSRPDGTQLRANAALVRMNGYTTEAQWLAAVRNSGTECYVDPSERVLFARELERVGQIKGFECEVYRHRTRERIWIREHAHVVRDAQGAVRFYEGTIEDISAHRAAAAERSDSEARWRLALESVGDGMWDWYVQDGVELLSGGVRALYGLDAGGPSGPEELDRRTHPDDVPAMLADRQAHFDGRTPLYANEHRVRCVDGSWKWVLSRGVVIARDADGRPLRMIGTHIDITERRQADSLRQARDAAQAADRAKTAFLSRVSHELRTPLNAILGFAQLLQLETEGRPRQWADILVDSGRHLLALVDDVLDLSTAQSGRLTLNLQAVRVAEVVEQAWLMLGEEAARTGVRRADVPLPALTVQADRRRLVQVLTNLLSNAVKYSPPDGVVAVRVCEAGDHIELRVVDAGPGIAPSQRGRLFQPFDRLGAERSTVDGTGLGLALALQFVEAMGGSLVLESPSVGPGSVFCVSLPRAPSDAVVPAFAEVPS